MSLEIDCTTGEVTETDTAPPPHEILEGPVVVPPLKDELANHPDPVMRHLGEYLFAVYDNLKSVGY